MKYLIETIKRLGKPVFFLVSSQWIERNEPLRVIDITSYEDLKYTLKRKGNERAEYVMLGFKVRPPRTLKDEQK